MNFFIPEWLVGALGLLAVEIVAFVIIAVRNMRSKKKAP